MGTRHRHRHEQVIRLSLFGNQRTVGNLIRTIGRNANVAFVLNVSVLACADDVALDVVRIYAVRTHADRIRRRTFFQQFVLGHHVRADHTPGFADVNLIWPGAVVFEFVFGQPPFTKFVLYVFGHARIVGDEIEPAFLILFVFADDLVAAFVTRFGVIVVVPDVVRAERAVIVGVGFVIGNAVEFLKSFAPASLKNPQHQFVLLRIVPGRFQEGNTVFGVVGQAHAEAIRLQFVVRRAVFARWSGGNARQNAAFRIARNPVRADFIFDRAEMMSVMQHTGLHAIPLFAVLSFGLTTYVVTDTCGSHQIAFVGGVNEHLAGVRFPAQRFD